jgi:hypothetical protein
MSEEAPAIVGIAALATDCTDPLGRARWWSRVLGGSIDIDPQGGATLRTPGGPSDRLLPGARAENGQEPPASRPAQPRVHHCD